MDRKTARGESDQSLLLVSTILITSLLCNSVISSESISQAAIKNLNAVYSGSCSNEVQLHHPKLLAERVSLLQAYLIGSGAAVVILG